MIEGTAVNKALIGAGVVTVLLLWYLQKSRKHTPAPPATRFEAFLVKDAAPLLPQPSQFSSFLKDASTSVGNAAREETVVDPVPDNAICVPIFYGTEFGFSKEVADVLAEQLKTTSSYWPVVFNMADLPKGVDLNGEQIVMFVCSTQGDGVPPYEAREFCEWLFSGAELGDLSSTFFSVCALGDRSYAHFCRCGERVQSAMKQKGAQELTESVKVDKEDWKAIHRWISSVLTTLPTLDLTPSETKFRKENDKKTMHIELELEGSGLAYLPGDAVGIYPNNRPDDVDELIELLHLDKDEKTAIPSWTPRIESEEEWPAEVPLRNALLRFYDLRTPRVKLFSVIRTYLQRGKGSADQASSNGSVVQDSGQSIHQLHGAELHKVEYLEKLIQDAQEREQYLQSRHVVDILSEFPCSNFSANQLLECLRPLQPRLYSISSSFLQSSDSLSVTVAEVKYSAHGKERVGVASTFLTERLQVGDRVPIYITSNPDFRLPSSLTTPLLMIGPGTGLAPFRSFILEKLAMAKDSPVGLNLLFFGCRRRAQDYLYRDSLEDWNSQGIIFLFTAFSREQEKKVYVQQLLWEHREAVWKLIQDGGHIYVCGDAQYMAPDVERCLVQILKSQGSIQDSEASQFLESLSQSRRYQRDVWF